MNKQLMRLAGLLALAACQQEPATDAPTYDLSLYAACEEMQAGDPRLAAEGCVLFQEGVLHALVVTKAANALSIQVVADGEPGQLIEETVSPDVQGLPTLEDINADGHLDLLIPRETGNVNTIRAVWLGGEGSGYTRLGEISGMAHSRTAEGLLAVESRSSAAAVEIAFYRVEPTALTEAVVVTVTGEQAADGSITTTCALTRKEEGETLTDAQLQEKFCAEPVATGVFN